MDFALAFSFPFQDEDWVKKIVLTAVIAVIPFVGQVALVGWLVELSRRVIQGETNPMPDWTDFGNLLILGLKICVIGFVYSLPFMFVSFPWAIMDSLFNSESASALYVLLSTCFGCLSFIYGLAFAYFLPAAVGELAATDDLGAAINPTILIARVRAAPSAFLLALLGTFVAGFISGLGIFFCFVGVLFTAAYASAVQGHLYGQTYIEATKA